MYLIKRNTKKSLTWKKITEKKIKINKDLNHVVRRHMVGGKIPEW